MFELLRRLHAAAVAAADPRRATAAALSHQALPTGAVHVIAIGKAADAMTGAAIEWLAEHGRQPAGGLVVGVESGPVELTVAPLPRLAGDHPLPGARSALAAGRLGEAAARVAPDDTALVLLSGGASALVGAPVVGIAPAVLQAAVAALLASGADIALVNQVRKRVLRWGAGRLAAALAPARVRVLAVSDVAGDDPAVVGSGPCAPDPLTASELLALLEARGLRDALPPALLAHLDAVQTGRAPETPKPRDPAFARVETEVVLRNTDAREGAALAAEREGWHVVRHAVELAGEAAPLGARLADALLDAAQRPAVHVWGGEATVTLPPDAPPGGRCQELALAAARRLHERGAGARVALLAAGTDGRDGPTDAAGAIVDGASWRAIAARGSDPAAALATHDAHRALDAAGLLLRTGATGTNVRDVVVGVATADPGL